MGKSLANGMASSQLFDLFNPVDIARFTELFTHCLRTIATNHVNARRFQQRRGAQHMIQQGPSGKAMQHLRQGRTHAGAFAGCEYDNFERHKQNITAITARWGDTRCAKTKFSECFAEPGPPTPQGWHRALQLHVR